MCLNSSLVYVHLSDQRGIREIITALTCSTTSESLKNVLFFNAMGSKYEKWLRSGYRLKDHTFLLGVSTLSLKFSIRTSFGCMN